MVKMTLSRVNGQRIASSTKSRHCIRQLRIAVRYLSVPEAIAKTSLRPTSMSCWLASCSTPAMITNCFGFVCVC